MKNKTIIYDLIVCLLIVFSVYFHTLNRPWIFYDEHVIYEETAVPIPATFKEIFEIISSFGVANNFGSSNLLYSSVSVNRSNLLGVPFLLFLGFFFKKNVLLYHLFNLFLHLLNTCFVYLMVRHCLSFDKESNLSIRLLIISLTLIWAIHPTLVESVLLSSNSAATFSYLMFFILLYDFLKNKERKSSLLRKITLPFIYLFSTLLHEYVLILPFILFTYTFIEKYSSGNIKTALKRGLEQTLPYLFGLCLYLIYFVFSSYEFLKPAQANPVILFFERVFWLSPQIFIHFLKLIFFPKVLSLDQTTLIHLGKSLFDTYSILCFIFMFLFWLMIPLSLFSWKKKTYKILLFTVLFFISYLPFSQILTPTYCLVAERYLYIPLFFLIFGFAILIKQYFTNSKNTIKAIAFFCIVILISCSLRTVARTNDWRDDSSLINSTIKTSSNYLYKGSRFNTLAETIENTNTVLAEKYFKIAQNCFNKATTQFKKDKEKHNDVPLILKFYGLDYDSLLVKTAYLISIEAFTKHKLDYKISLDILSPYLKNLDGFDPRSLELYANLLIRTNEIKKGKEIFLYAYNKFPSSSFLLLSLIRFEGGIEKDFNATKEYLERGLQLFPYVKEILLEAVKYYQLENNLQEYAKYSYLYGLRTHSKFHYQEALGAYLILNKLEKSNKIINKLYSIDKSDPKTRYLTSIYFAKKKEALNSHNIK